MVGGRGNSSNARKKTFFLSGGLPLGAGIISIFCLQRPNWMFPIGGTVVWIERGCGLSIGRNSSITLSAVGTFHLSISIPSCITSTIQPHYYVQNQMWYSYGYLDYGCPSLGFCLADQQMFQSLSHFQMALSLTSWRCIARERQ